MKSSFLIEADGGSRGNPGPSGYGALIKEKLTGKIIAQDSGFIGNATNNIAEYHGLIAGLMLAKKMDQLNDLEVLMDSKLVIEQMSGRWKVKNKNIKILNDKAKSLILNTAVIFTWIPREKNVCADKLANAAMDLHMHKFANI